MNALHKTLLHPGGPAERRERHDTACGTGVAFAPNMPQSPSTPAKSDSESRELIHDLRSPLQAIGLHAALLRRELTRGQDGGVHHLDTILRELRRIQALMERSPAR